MKNFSGNYPIMNPQEVKERFLYTPSKKLADAIDVLFCFPGTYYVGMSSLGFLSLFQILDSQDFIKPARVFIDSEAKKPSPEALVGFTYSFENDFISIFKILEKLKIPVLKSERDDKYPLVFAGGPVVTANPEPFVDFFDFFVIGDGEEIIIKITEIIYSGKAKSRSEKLRLISEIEGVYNPDYFNVTYNADNTVKEITPVTDNIREFIEKQTLSYNDRCLHSPILTDKTVFADTFLLEVERGCSQKCLFCLASYLNDPVRYPKKELIIDAIKLGLHHTRRIGLMGALITEHPDFEEILEFIYTEHLNNEVKLTTSSLRADKLNQKIAGILAACDQKQVTISVEAGSERLRKRLNKKLTDSDIFRCIDICMANNIRNIKMYAMAGLPGEESSDIEALIKLVNDIKIQYPRADLILSLNSFIAKAHTPFERSGVNDYEAIGKEMNKVKSDLINIIKVRTSSTKWDRVQALISRGDRRIGELLYRVYNYGGSLGSFNRAFKEYRGKLPEIDWYVSRERQTCETLPWQRIKFNNNF